MSDPAVEAALRAWIKPRGSWARPHFDPTNGLAKSLTDSACEALRPIRELHQRDTTKATSCAEDCAVHDDMDCPLDVDVPVCRECYQLAEAIDYYFSERTGWQEHVAWPCATARLVYPEGELT